MEASRGRLPISHLKIASLPNLLATVFMLLPQPSIAMERVNPNCTLPDSGKYLFVSAPGIRSSLDIVWTSLATLIACTYSVLHLNVPPQDREKRLIDWASLWTSLKWTLVTILIPDLVLIKAMWDFLAARELLKKLHKNVPATKDLCTMAHMQFALMGGFVLQYNVGRVAKRRLRTYPGALLPSGQAISDEPTDAPVESGYKSNAPNDLLPVDAQQAPEAEDQESICLAPQTPNIEPGDQATNTKLLASRGISSQVQSVEEEETSERTTTGKLRYFHLTLVDFVKALEKDLVSPSVLPSEAEIMDKSKSDVFAKSLALLQICYFVVGVLVRVDRSLQVTPLEVGVCAFVVCSAVTYCLVLSRPKSVKTAHVVAKYWSGVPLRFQTLSEHEYMDSVFLIRGDRVAGEAVPNNLYFNPSPYDSQELDTMLVYSAAPSIFSAIHLAGWNLSFPSTADLWVWRTAALLSTTGILSAGLMTVVAACVEHKSRILSRVFSDDNVFLYWALQGVLFCISRLVLIVEMFRTLFYLQSGAFVATWTANIPHFG